ncbi:MAG: class I SAM-dependent methyltransferase [Sulfuricaulis sp.]|nr:class I SAM-dependent methyltransferase [Sulfuricaulis sp.]
MEIIIWIGTLWLGAAGLGWFLGVDRDAVFVLACLGLYVTLAGIALRGVGELVAKRKDRRRRVSHPERFER